MKIKLSLFLFRFLKDVSACDVFVDTFMLCSGRESVLPVEMVMFSSKEQCGGFTLL